ncbi:conjugal transfer protein TraD [Brucella intermedia]|uniref:conjugal transfer protein TraD n=1 Tax=Brucella TaxID=234 RepID=UPI000946402B|nr:conjugal transfer protein TraD [Brucella intermedia]
MAGDRKREVREKFLLGGIVVKAGLSKADRAFLLGGLLELTRVTTGSPEHRRLRAIGKQAFLAQALKQKVAHIDEVQEWL